MLRLCSQDFPTEVSRPSGSTFRCARGLKPRFWRYRFCSSQVWLSLWLPWWPSGPSFLEIFSGIEVVKQSLLIGMDDAAPVLHSAGFHLAYNHRQYFTYSHYRYLVPFFCRVFIIFEIFLELPNVDPGVCDTPNWSVCWPHIG